MGGSVGWAGGGGGGPPGRPPTALALAHCLHQRNATRNMQSMQGVQGSTSTGHTLGVPSDTETNACLSPGCHRLDVTTTCSSIVQ